MNEWMNQRRLPPGTCVVLLLFASLNSWLWGSIFSDTHPFSYSPAAHFIHFKSQAIKSNDHLLPRVGSRASLLKIPCVATVCFACTWLFKQTGETYEWSLLASGLSRMSHKQSDFRPLIELGWEITSPLIPDSIQWRCTHVYITICSPASFAESVGYFSWVLGCF